MNFCHRIRGGKRWKTDPSVSHPKQFEGGGYLVHKNGIVFILNERPFLITIRNDFKLITDMWLFVFFINNADISKLFLNFSQHVAFIFFKNIFFNLSDSFDNFFSFQNVFKYFLFCVTTCTSDRFYDFQKSERSYKTRNEVKVFFQFIRFIW